MILRSGTLTAIINDENTQLTNLRRVDAEYMHGGGKPARTRTERDTRGWPNSEIIMFPLVGPAENNEIETPRGTVAMPQHGILRYLQFSPVQHTERTAAYVVHYKANTLVPNDRVANVRWPYDFTVEKTYELIERGLRFTVRITNDDTEPMPYNSGWHPAFNRVRDGKVYASKHMYQLSTIEDPKKAVVVQTKSVMTDATENLLNVQSDCGHFMIWSPPGSPLVCLEPILAPGNPAGAKDFPFTLEAGATKAYSATILLE